MQFSRDEWTVMMIYNPGTRTGLMEALQDVEKELTSRDRNLKKWTKSVLSKLNNMSDVEFEKLDLYPDF